MLQSAEIEALFTRYGPRYKWLAALTAMLGVMSMILASTIINVAIPAIMRDFGVGHSEVQWLATAFLASMTAGMLVNAWCVQVFGIRATYIGTMTVFLLASALGGFAPSFDWLVASRVLQGLMAGINQPLALLVIFQVFPPEQRGRGMGIFGMGVVLGPTVGPVLGGVLVDLASWRAVFLVVVPSCLLGLYMARRYLVGRDAAAARPRLDVLGLLLLATWLTALLWALANGRERGWEDTAVVVALGVGVSALAAFVAWELRCRAPLLDFRVFRTEGFISGTLLSVVLGAGLFGSVYLLPLFMQDGLGYSPTVSGLLLMPAGLCMAFLFPFAGQLSDRVEPGPLIALGLTAFVISSVLLGVPALSATFAWVAVWTMLGRAGLTFMMPPLTTGAMGLLTPAQLSQGSGVINFSRQLGGAFGVNLLALLLEQRSATHLAAAGAEGLQAHGQAFHEAFLVLGALFLIGALPLWTMHRAARRRRAELREAQPGAAETA